VQLLDNKMAQPCAFDTKFGQRGGHVEDSWVQNQVLDQMTRNMYVLMVVFQISFEQNKQSTRQHSLGGQSRSQEQQYKFDRVDKVVVHDIHFR
jgi:hypothetical protein